MDVIKIEHLVKKFGDFTAVGGVSLEIKRGEVFGLLGPNGAGKTTIINNMLGLIKPTSGTIIVEGVDMAKNPDTAKGHIGLVTQETVVETELTGDDNLRLFGHLYHVPEEQLDKRVDQLITLAGLHDFRTAYAGTYSGGMQRRLAISKALIHQPTILVLDEPTVGLDVQNRANIWNLLKDINEKNGVTILLTTQYLEEADSLCNRIAIIDHGKIKALGTPTQLKHSIGTGSIIEIAVEKEDMKSVLKLLKEHMDITAQQLGDRISMPAGKDSTRTLSKVLDLLHKHKINAINVSVHEPTLDDVFLKLTGSSLRDTAGQTNTADAARLRFGR